MVTVNAQIFTRVQFFAHSSKILFAKSFSQRQTFADSELQRTYTYMYTDHACMLLHKFSPVILFRTLRSSAKFAKFIHGQKIVHLLYKLSETVVGSLFLMVGMEIISWYYEYMHGLQVGWLCMAKITGAPPPLFTLGGGAVANRLRRRTSDQTVLGSNPTVAAALSPWTRLFTPIVPRRSLHIRFY